MEEAHRRLLLRAAQSLGLGTAADLADYYRMSVRLARTRLEELVKKGQLLAGRVQGWEDAVFLHPEARVPKKARGESLLSPFDPLVWFRPRLARLFGFDYRLEIFVPKPRRRWGYYVLPFLLGSRLVARVDLKADRKQNRLRVLSAYLEDQADLAFVGQALARELTRWAEWLELSRVENSGKGLLATQLTAALG